MSDEMLAYSESRHPAPHRDRIHPFALFYGLFAAPLAWVGNLIVTYAFASYSCYPAYQPLDRVLEGFGFVRPLVIALYLAALAICASSFVTSYVAWRRTGEESEGHAHHLMEVGEGRTRYLGLIGMSFSVLFFGAILFGAFVPWILPLCVR